LDFKGKISVIFNQLHGGKPLWPLFSSTDLIKGRSENEDVFETDSSRSCRGI
jgi:hypothetical protein